MKQLPVRRRRIDADNVYLQKCYQKGQQNNDDHRYIHLNHRETSGDALLEFIVSTENLSVCLLLKCNQTKLYTKKCDGPLVNDDKIMN